MREPPPHVSDALVLATVQAHWDAGVTAVEHLPVGFGAHHWRADDASGEPRLFVTYDGADPRARGGASRRRTPRRQRSSLPFVVPSLAASAGTYTTPLADGLVSVTPWLDGDSGRGPLRDRAEAEATAAMLAALHARPVPTGTVDWRPVVDRAFPARLALRLGTPWETGPYGEHARAAISERIEAVGRWTTRYLALVDAAASRRWVATHGEPHSANQLVAPTRRVLVDWETLRRAPAERDLRVLVEHGHEDLCPGADREMVEMFDLEWRLDEISQYADWFAAPHSGTASDEVAYGGLRGELDRAEFA